MQQERRSFLKRSGTVLLGLAAASTVSPRGGQAESTVSRPAMIIDLNRCTGCHSCVIACKEQNHTPTSFFNTRIIVSELGSYPDAWQSYKPELCHQCQDAPCVEACGYDATFSLKNGIVVTDWARCTGDGACVDACPYGARFLDPAQGNRADKCDFCIELLEKGLTPACVEACSSGARVFGDLSYPQGEFADRLAQIEKDGAQGATPETERVLYLAPRKDGKAGKGKIPAEQS